VIRVHVFCLARPVVDVPSCFFAWDMAWDGKCWFLVEGSYDCYEACLGLAVFSVFIVPQELHASGWYCSIGRDLSVDIF